MKCPFCGKETESGYIIGGKGIFWSKNEYKLWLSAKKKEGELKLRGVLDCSGLEGEKCQNCKKIIVNY